ncbi:sulfonylurea receptor isoform X3 [Choristoneura fumiferana]|uniref:sulfonylurea receptor isoform X3 n=1 Tax=Choristoneura fumiferana TaxID=7141 RepID=UPI003D159821
MEAVCERGDGACAARASAAALHALHLYCACVATALLCCCKKKPLHRTTKRWRGQNVRGVASLVLGAAQCCAAAAAALRPTRAAPLAAAALALPAWLLAATLHVALWTRRSAASLLYLAIYWMLIALSNAAILWECFENEPSPNHIEIYVYTVSMFMALIVSAVDCVCFYDEVTKRFQKDQKSSTDNLSDVTYLHNDSHFYSKISFYWLNPLLYRGYVSPLEQDDLGELPEVEKSIKHYTKLKRIYNNQKKTKLENNNSPSIWSCYIRMVWPNFYIAGVFKLFSDLIGVVPPLGLAVVIQFIQDPRQEYDINSHVTIQEFLSNGYIMLLIVTLALIGQGFLSQNSTHLVTVEGTRLKTALQGMVFDKCMRLAPWSAATPGSEEEAPLLQAPDSGSTQAGLLANLVSQDTYNVMSCVGICHYTWAIPLKVAVILYLLYTKLGVSAIIGSAASILFITPLQFYIGKKLSDNSKEIGKCTDHRISKLTEILQGMHVIKLYVWEDLFNEKILNLREVELKFLNKESIYWSCLTFTTQASTILVTVITFTVYYFLDNSNTFTAVNIFTGLALFNQLSVPLLILPVTVLMVIQALVSTNRIKEYLDLPESNNVREEENIAFCQRKRSDKFNIAFVDIKPEDNSLDNNVVDTNESDDPNSDQYSDEDMFTTADDKEEILVKFRNAAFTWGLKNDSLLEVDHLDIPAGKLIMVVGATGSGKTSFLSCTLGEMYIERGDVCWNGNCSTWYAGQPPWLLEGSVRTNIVMDSAWCPRKYARILRATGLRPDLQLLPEGDATQLGSGGAPLSGGQRVRLAVARALYAGARLLALDEPLGALDAALARHVVARALVPAARRGAAVLLATNRLELLHYADLVIAMEDGRVVGFGRPSESDPALARWARRAAEARAAAARGGAGPPGGSARERTRLVRALSRARFYRTMSDDTTVGISEATGAHLLTEVPTCAGGSWRRSTLRQRPSLSRQFSSPPPTVHHHKWRRDVRRAVSADESCEGLRREASLLRRLLRRPRAHHTLGRWTPKTLRRLISSDSDTPHEENQANAGTMNDTALETSCLSIGSNGVDVTVSIADKATSDKDDTEQENDFSECSIWWAYARACGWWGAAYWAAAVAAQGFALAADCWLGYTAAQNSQTPLTDQQMWHSVRTYAWWSLVGAAAAGAAQAACACAGAAARRTLHERMLHAALHASPAAAAGAPPPPPPGTALQRFGADIAVIDKKLPIAVSRWVQLALLCGAALLVNAVAAPWTLLALLPACLFYLGLQSVYLHNARELQGSEARSAAGVVSLAAQATAGGGTVRAGRLQPRMRAAFLARLDDNHKALLLLNAANRWLGLTLDLVGAASVCVSLGVSVCGGSTAAALAGTYALLLPAFLAHLAKCRADLDLQLAAVARVRAHSALPQEDYREDCPIPTGWERNGKIEMENLVVQQEPGALPILNNINLAINPGEKVAICGRSGSGKSTLLLSCVGGTTITNGRILVDGVDARRVPLRALRHRIVVLPQEATMFSGTLRENLDPLAVHTDEEIWHSIRAVGLYDFVTSQPAGLECSVGKARCGWSGGRAARASAARALLHARLASALLLDEPGAALDAPGERALLAGMAAAAPDTTIITVAHRVSSVRGYDRGVVLEAGRAVEQGPVPALLGTPGSRLAAMLATPHDT